MPLPFFITISSTSECQCRGHAREVAGDGAQIGVVWEIRSGVGFRLMVILVFIDIHKINLALIVLYNEKKEYCKKYPRKHIIMLNKDYSPHVMRRAMF